MFRYVGFLWHPEETTAWHRAAHLSRRLLATSSDWQIVADRPGMRVFAAGVIPGTTEVRPLPNDAGVVLGTLFDRNSDHTDASRCRAATLGLGEADRIVKSRGQELVSRYWGRYVAFLQDDQARASRVLRDPTGQIPCFRTKCAGVHIVFSSMLDCMELGLPKFTPNWKYVMARLSFSTGQADMTGLNEVQEIYGGQCVRFGADGEAAAFYWNPIEIANSGLLEDPSYAAHALRATTKACTHAWASRYDSVLLRLSGGLDSSIVLSCIADAVPAPKITCLTYFLPKGNSDERPWARMAAEPFDCEHLELPRDPAAIRFSDLLKVYPSVNPVCGGATFLELSEVERRIAHESRAGAVCTGNGGDSLLGASTRPQGATDYVRRHGLDWGLLRVVAELAPNERTSVWTVLGRALRDGLVKKECDFLKREVRKYRKLLAEEVFEQTLQDHYYPHPWFRGSATQPRGVVLLMMLQAMPVDYYDQLLRTEYPGPEPLHPLNSQPIIELCLRIPSYIHNEHGRDRGLARRAFAPDVPAQVLRREWKDHGEGQPEATLMHNLAFAREMLLDGRLVSQGILDRRRLEESLRGAPGRETAAGNEVLDCLMVETWVRDWTDGQESSIQSVAIEAFS